METVELVVFIGIAVIIGGLIIGFIAGIDTSQVYDSMKRMLLIDETVRYENVDADEFASTAYRAWRQCGYGQREHELIVSLTGNKNLTKEGMFNWYNKFNLCHSIQSQKYKCGNREDVDLQEELIKPPALIKITCSPEEQKLVIEIVS